MPYVSIIMSVYKPNKDGLFRTINSVLKQTFGNFEFIIIKDDPNENILELLQEYEKKDKRIKLIDNKNNIGLVKSLNKGLKIAKGDYIARIDVDDWWESEKLKLQIDVITKKDLVLVGTQVNLVDENLNPLIEVNSPLDGENIVEYLKRGKNPFTHSSVLFKKIENIYYNENALYTEDFELWCRYSFLGKMENLKERLTNYVVDLNSITNNKRYLMFANATKVCENYVSCYLTKNKDCFENGLISKPIKDMSLSDRLFSKYYSLGAKELFCKNKTKYYCYIFIALVLNPKVLVYQLKRVYFRATCKLPSAKSNEILKTP